MKNPGRTGPPKSRTGSWRRSRRMSSFCGTELHSVAGIAKGESKKAFLPGIIFLGSKTHYCTPILSLVMSNDLHWDRPLGPIIPYPREKTRRFQRPDSAADVVVFRSDCATNKNGELGNREYDLGMPYISEHLTSLRQEITDLRSMNARCAKTGDHSAMDQTAMELRTNRLREIKQELSKMLNRPADPAVWWEKFRTPNHAA
jgi:hypothetical protein